MLYIMLLRFTGDKSVVKSLIYFDDDNWVDEAKAVFVEKKKQNSEKLQSLLREMFDAHHDVFSLVIAFLRRTGKCQQAKQSLPRVAMDEFKRWLKEKKNGGQKCRSV